jgi:hypothetical protein
MSFVPLFEITMKYSSTTGSFVPEDSTYSSKKCENLESLND